VPYVALSDRAEAVSRDDISHTGIFLGGWVLTHVPRRNVARRSTGVGQPTTVIRTTCRVPKLGYGVELRLRTGTLLVL